MEHDASVKTCAVHGFEQNLTGPRHPGKWSHEEICHARFTAVAAVLHWIGDRVFSLISTFSPGLIP